MAKVNFADSRKQAEDAGLLGSGDYFKCKEGDNRLRLLSECLPHQGEYQGRPNFKWLCYVLDRRDGKVKPYFMPHKVYKAIEALQTNPDYMFEEVPMPYDVTVHAKGAGTKEVEYSLIPARKETPLTPEEESSLDQAKPLKELQKLLFEKAGKKSDNPPPHSDDDEPPFAWLMPMVLPTLGVIGMLA